jgi:hypothetical protein
MREAQDKPSAEESVRIREEGAKKKLSVGIADAPQGFNNSRALQFDVSHVIFFDHSRKAGSEDERLAIDSTSFHGSRSQQFFGSEADILVWDLVPTDPRPRF